MDGKKVEPPHRRTKVQHRIDDDKKVFVVINLIHIEMLVSSMFYPLVSSLIAMEPLVRSWYKIVLKTKNITLQVKGRRSKEEGRGKEKKREVVGFMFRLSDEFALDVLQLRHLENKIAKTTILIEKDLDE